MLELMVTVPVAAAHRLMVYGICYTYASVIFYLQLPAGYFSGPTKLRHNTLRAAIELRISDYYIVCNTLRADFGVSCALRVCGPTNRAGTCVYACMSMLSPDVSSCSQSESFFSQTFRKKHLYIRLCCF